MAGQTLFERYELLVATATIAAHATAEERGFRQRDVRWLLEFFVNWVETSIGEEGLPFQNTQIARYLDRLVDDGLAKRAQRRTRPRYTLTRVGLVELLARVVSKPYYPQKEHFFFLHSFLLNYRARILELARREDLSFPYALQLELEALCDANALLKKQRYHAERELKKLERRIDDQVGTAALTEELLAQGYSYGELVAQVERRYPYSVYSKKPISQFLAERTEQQGLWELQIGGLRRNEQMWQQSREMLVLHIEQLEALQRDSGSRPPQGGSGARDPQRR